MSTWLTILAQATQAAQTVANEGITLTTGNVISLLGFLFAVGGALINFGYFKGKTEETEKRLQKIEDEKKKELTEQTHRNSDYNIRLAVLETGIKAVIDSLAEIKADIKRIATR